MTKENGLKRLNYYIKQMEDAIAELRRVSDYVSDTHVDMYERTITETVDKYQYLCCVGGAGCDIDTKIYKKQDMIFAPALGIYTKSGALTESEKIILIRKQKLNKILK